MKKLNNYDYYIINFLFVLLPVSIILGNFATNLNLLLIFLITSIIFFLKKEQIRLKINFIDKLILVFFFYTLITLIINYFIKLYNNIILDDLVITKTILYQRYLIYYFIIRILYEKKILNLDWIVKISALCVCFVCLDVIFQFFFGKDFFGIEPVSKRHFSGVFGEELIAGGYLQRFGLFVVFFWLTLKEKSIFKKKYILFLLNLFIIIGIILSGNRMPVILFVLSLLIYSYYHLSFKKYLIKILTLILIFFSLIIYSNKTVRFNFYNFYKDGVNLIETIMFTDTSKASYEILKKPYVTEFHCSKLFIKQGPIFGGGIRSYRTHPGGCLTHSHNYYLEILVDLGILGFMIVLLIIIFIAKKVITKMKTKSGLPFNSLPFLSILVVEFFPIRTAGSIFSTNNASIIFFFLAIFVSLIFSNNSKKTNLYF